MNSTQNTLKQFNLRLTGCREVVLEVFQQSKKAISQGELEHLFNEKFDRVTIYRTLKTFLESGLIHKVLDEGGIRYAVCKEACGHVHHHDHVHFKCLQCGETSCLDSILIPNFKLPTGYQLQELNLLAAGICPKCA